MKEMIGGCCVCSDEQGWAENPLVYCDGKGCNVAVHQACYGIESVPLGPWFCRKCEFKGDKSTVICKLCPNEDGALKRTDTNEWAHVICALYIPEVEFGNVKTMEPIIISKLPTNRFLKTCYICEKKRDSPTGPKNAGACMACQKAECPNSFHVTCGQRAGLLCEKRSKTRDNIKYTGFCSFHYKKEFRPSQFLAVPAYVPPPIKEIDPNDVESKVNALLDKHRWDMPFLSSSNKTSCSLSSHKTSSTHSLTTQSTSSTKPLATPFQDALSSVTSSVVAPSLFGGHDLTAHVKEESSWSLSKFMSLHHAPALPASTSSSVAQTTPATITTTAAQVGSGSTKTRPAPEKKRSLGGDETTSVVAIKREANKMDRDEHERKSKMVKRKATTLDTFTTPQPKASPLPRQPKKKEPTSLAAAASLPKPLFSDDDDSFGSIKNIEDAIRETDSTIAHESEVETVKKKSIIKTEHHDEPDEGPLPTLSPFNKTASLNNSAHKVGSSSKVEKVKSISTRTPSSELLTDDPFKPRDREGNLTKRSAKKKEPSGGRSSKLESYPLDTNTPTSTKSQTSTILASNETTIFQPAVNLSNAPLGDSLPASTSFAVGATLKVEAGEEDAATFLPVSDDPTAFPTEDLLAQFDFQKLQQEIFAENFKTLLQTLPTEMLNTIVAYDEIKTENQRLQNYIKTLQMEYSILKSLHSSLQ